MKRFPKTVATPEEARAYYRNRAIQLLRVGWQRPAPEPAEVTEICGVSQ